MRRAATLIRRLWKRAGEPPYDRKALTEYVLEPSSKPVSRQLANNIELFDEFMNWYAVLATLLICVPEVDRQQDGRTAYGNRYYVNSSERLARPPSCGWEPHRKGQWSIRINRQWRVCFRWDDDAPGPTDVEIADVH